MAPRVRSRPLLVAVAALLVLASSACSGGSDDAEGSSSDPRTTAEAAPAPDDDATTDDPASDDAGPDDPAPDDPDADPPAMEAEELGPDDDLYAVPDPIPDGEHGTLLRYQEILPTQVEGARTWRVMYLSESLAGDPIVVTGTVLVPTAPAPEEGRMVLANAHGTTGIADECAPSKGSGDGVLLLMGPMIERG